MAMRDKGGLGWIVLIDDNLIKTQIGHKGESIVRRESGPVCVRGILTIADNPRTTLMLD